MTDPLVLPLGTVELFTVPVTANVDPRSDAVRFAFVADPDLAPTDDDWHDGVWDVTATNPYVAMILLGDQITLAAGWYVAWLNVADDPEHPVRPVGSVRVTGMDVVDPALIVQVSELERTFGYFTAAEARVAADMLAGQQDALELYLNRPLTVRTFTDTLDIGAYGRVRLPRQPVVSISSAAVDGVPYSPAAEIERLVLYFGTKVTVTYVAGIDGTQVPAVRRVLIRAARRAWPAERPDRAQAAALTATAAAAQASTTASGRPPVIKAFGVEGLNVTYSDPSESPVLSTGSAADLFTAQELASVARLRIPVLR